MKTLLEHLEAEGEVFSPKLRSAFRTLERRVAELEALVRSQAEEIRELRRQVKQNSSNSSLPPSSDLPHQKPARQKKKSGRRRGAQPGHEPHQRRRVPPERVDRVIDHYPERCRHCGDAFTVHRSERRPERRQVIEVPPIRALVTEHRLHRLRCRSCGTRTRGRAPAAVVGPVSFGARLVALCAMLTVRLRASRRNLQRVLGDLLDVEPPCVGQVQTLLEEASAACLGAYAEVRTRMRASPAVGVDESGWSLRGRPRWLWTAVTGELSFFRLAERRSGWARQRLLGRGYSGIVTSDRLGAYNALPPPKRQLCWAHLRRDFAAWQDYSGSAEEVASAAEQCAEELFRHWHAFRDGACSRTQLRERLEPVQKRLRESLEAGPSCEVSRVRKNCKQLLALWPALWSFATYAEVEPTNNEAERALRAGVIWRKTSFGSGSGRGMRMVERLLTVAETCKKQKRDLLTYLSAAIDAHRSNRLAPSVFLTP